MSLRCAIFIVLACLAHGAVCAGDAAADGAVAAARAAVEQRLGHAYQRVELNATTRPEHLSAGKGVLEFRVLPIAGRWPRSRFTAMVEVRSGGRVLRTVSVGFALSALGPAWVYRDDFAERLPADQLPLEERDVDVALSVAPPLPSPDALQGKRLRRPVRAGQVASIEDFEDVPDVDNRQQVRLTASYGGITVERAGVAMRAANKGEMVLVQVAGTSEPVKAMVTDRGVAQVVP